jgi:molybdopterin synthase catalytic subunit
MIECRVVSEAIEVADLLTRSADDSAGAISTFVGVARRSSSARSNGLVERLEYEAYVPMAEREMGLIATEAVEQYGVVNLLVHHRIGRLEIGDAAVAIVVSTAHRAAAFDACRYVIEELKKRVPIWKKEVFDDGEIWVDPRP